MFVIISNFNSAKCKIKSFNWLFLFYIILF
nr:MAG TPA: hypothetical protein [Caudoviricetes sp.]